MTPRLTTEELGHLASPPPIDGLVVARLLIEAGVPVFRARPALDGSGQWDPLGGHNNSGYWLPKDWQHTKPDLSVLDRWRHGDALCAVTGHTLDVLDVDPRNGGDATAVEWKAAGDWPNVYGIQTTPSGGTHELVAALHIAKTKRYGIDVQAGADDGTSRGFAFIAPTVRVSKATGEVAPYVWSVAPDPVLLASRLAADGSGERLVARLRADKPRRARKTRTAAPGGNPSGRTSWVGGSDYETNAVSGEIAQLDALTEAATDGGVGYVGEPWDETVFKVACNLLEIANSDWAKLTPKDAERLVLEHAPIDDGFTTERIQSKVESAKVKVAGHSRKKPLELQGEALKPKIKSRDKKPTTERALQLKSLADVEFKVTEWAWDGVIPFGTLTGIAGWAGIGKSTVTAWLVSGWTRGTFEGELRGQPTSVVTVAGEDDSERQLAPRLAVAGADLGRVFEAQATTRMESGQEINSILNLEEDLPRIREQLIATGARVLILDPILSFVSGDPNHQRDVRAALDPLAALARELNIAVVLVMHFKKGAGVAGEKVSGSHVWRDALRSLLVMAHDKESDYRVLTLDKSNYGPAGRSMLFAVESASVLGKNSKGEEKPQGVSVARFMGESSKSVDDILNEEQTKRDARHQVDGDTADIIAWIVSQPHGVRWIDICKQAGIDPNAKDADTKRAVVNLSRKLGRAVNRGDLSSPEKGLYQRPSTLRPLEGMEGF